ncbi:hypothetical protein DFR74_1152 [Nocardia puris]|uniref:Uncharacterized protein n=1 Tax=Nocardia puris TaxID=208602 RepID=A0A366D6R3_9NOCA|nr:hypothetical protein DFR74_1152 [Nocardia puris]
MRAPIPPRPDPAAGRHVTRGWWKISRPCYDKWWRCPGWNGGGPHFARRVLCTEKGTGFITFGMDKATYHALPVGTRYPPLFALGRCDGCDVIVLPRWVRRLSVPQWWNQLRSWWQYRGEPRVWVEIYRRRIRRCLSHFRPTGSDRD